MADSGLEIGQAIRRAVDAVWLRLDAPDLEPSPARRGNPELAANAQSLGERLEVNALGRLEELRSAISDAEQLDSYELSIAYAAAAIAGLHYLGGETAPARAELSAAAALAPSGEEGDLLREAAADPESFVLLLHAQWLMRKERVTAGRERARALLQRRPSAQLTRCARQIVEILEPLASSPWLLRVGGCGAHLYGSREARDDGTYIATRCLTLLWVPVYPLDAFRVSREGGGYRFYGKAELAPSARRLRWLATVGMLAAVALAGFVIYLKSDRHLLALQVAAATKLEGPARDQHAASLALARYEQIFHDFEPKVSSSALEPVALGIARTTTAPLGDSLTPAQVDDALAALRRFASLPAAARGGDAARFVQARVERWLTALGSVDTERATASLRLLGAANVALGSPPTLAARERALCLGLGQALTRDWPALAIELIARAPNEPGAAPAMDRALAGLPKTALERLSPDLSDWIDQHTGVAAFASSSAWLGEVKRNAEARARLPGRAELLEKGSEEALTSANKASPDDAALAVVLAQRLRARGAILEASGVLDLLGTIGQLSQQAATERARLVGEVGQRAAAESIYEHWLLLRLPGYEATVFKLTRRRRSLRHDIAERADRNELPSEIQNQLDNAAQEQVQSVYDTWVDSQLAADAEVKRLTERLEQLDLVVPLALDLGTLELESALASSGEARNAELAKAERTFLSIESGGEGLPAYHLGLGSVYFRLGKATEGERELSTLLERKEPELSLEVARTYRELGQESRARVVAQSVFDQGPKEPKQEAAILLSLLANSDEDREKWLLESDQASPFVKSSLTEVQARRAFRAGNLALADDKYRQAYEIYLNNQTGEHSASTNNAALALGSRYLCTGDERQLVRAAELCEKARRDTPSDVVVLQNLAHAEMHLAELDALRGLITLPALKLSSEDLQKVIGWLADGSMRDALFTNLRQNVHFRRSLDATRRARVLGPSWLDSYYRELHWLGNFEDAAGLRALGQQASAQPLEHEDAKKARQEWLDGVHHDRDHEALDSSAKRFAATLAALPSSDTASRAVVRALWADDEDSLALMDWDVAHAEAAVALLREAAKDWPTLGLQSELAAELMRVAQMRTLEQSSPEQRRQLRGDGATITLWHWLKASGSPELAALKARPEFTEAAAVYGGSSPRQLGALSYLIATVVGNSDLARRARAQLDQPYVLPLVETSALLTDDDESRARVELTREILSSKG